MKKFLTAAFIVALLLAAIVLGMGAQTTAQAKNDYLRIHVRANSNEQIDQSVKYKVKDEIVKYITPRIGECTDKPAAMRVISGMLEELEEVADNTLSANGFNYKSRASVRAEEFPTRVYGDLTLDEGLRRTHNRARLGHGRQLVVRNIPAPLLHLRHDRRRIPLYNLRYHK